MYNNLSSPLLPPRSTIGSPVLACRAYTEGIATLEPRDIRYAEELGYRIKLLGITKRTPAGIELRVHPTLIPAKRLIANVEGVMNAIVGWWLHLITTAVDLLCLVRGVEKTRLLGARVEAMYSA